jgi:hypothetical protein
MQAEFTGRKTEHTGGHSNRQPGRTHGQEELTDRKNGQEVDTGKQVR